MYDEKSLFAYPDGTEVPLAELSLHDLSRLKKDLGHWSDDTVSTIGGFHVNVIYLAELTFEDGITPREKSMRRRVVHEFCKFMANVLYRGFGLDSWFFEAKAYDLARENVRLKKGSRKA